MVFYSAILGKVIMNFGKWREFRNFLWECNCLEQIPKSVGQTLERWQGARSFNEEN